MGDNQATPGLKRHGTFEPSDDAAPLPDRITPQIEYQRLSTLQLTGWGEHSGGSISRAGSSFSIVNIKKLNLPAMLQQSQRHEPSDQTCSSDGSTSCHNG
jgi:hypothetical protein